ncbi:MAG: iron export ABC transporter permease subunit FetB [Candidatus Accumulibacter sp.]|uniref:ABC transporter permease n=1 Tax=Accumulibacter sp. TaxID=2053492 RepID=UPI0019D8C66D|nr:iron export ABC transporter permease subunit FetB [Accumulibacter sp.]MBE2260873.1 iron export ABC transporter permease subunit FetB [Paracoccaceae bacterium]MCB1944037.1 iron export ABC transporter permease subunit FetB [Accumulibacter sp.]MCP5247843.1 iron export ABC transporter permease subunit FetB [Accumulibacter sp.]
MNAVALSPFDLAIAALLIVALAGLSLRLQLGVERQLLASAARSTIQLLLIGLVLKVLFDNARLPWVVLMAGVMIAVAGREVMVRQKRRLIGWWGFGVGTLSMFVSSFTVTVMALALVIGTTPWYAPQYAIPLLGMILGNTMNGISLGLDRLTQDAAQKRQIIETRLALGESWQGAISDSRHEAIRVGLIPIINAMSAAGIVSLPGMMTGQILAGTPPVEAVKYQILVMFLIAGGTGFGTVVAVSLAARRLFDERHRLRLDRLRLAGK